MPKSEQAAHLQEWIDEQQTPAKETFDFYMDKLGRGIGYAAITLTVICITAHVWRWCGW